MSESAARRPRTKPPGVRREELLDAAQQLFLAQGVAATSVDEIVSAAGVAKGTFYLYFPSKEKVLAALRERYVRSLRDALAAAVEGCAPDDWRGRLNAWVATAVHDQVNRTALHDVAFHEAHIGDHRHGDSPVVDQLAGVLAAGNAAGAWTVPDERFTAVVLFHAMHGAIDENTPAADGDRGALIASLQQFFGRAVGD